MKLLSLSSTPLMFSGSHLNALGVIHIDPLSLRQWDTTTNRIIFCVSTTLHIGQSVTLFKRFFVANIYWEECQPILNSKPFTTYSGKYHTCKTRNWTCICNIWTILGFSGRYWNHFWLKVPARVTLIVLALQPGWDEMENLRGNLRKFERE